MQTLTRSRHVFLILIIYMGRGGGTVRFDRSHEERFFSAGLAIVTVLKWQSEGGSWSEPNDVRKRLRFAFEITKRE